MHTKSVDVLLVEDSPEDVDLMRMAFEESKWSLELNVACDGVEAMTYLHDAVQLPDLVILDLNMPRKSGREVLQEMKEDDRLKRIPVVIMTTSRAREDILSCYDKHTNCYICKPLDFDRYVEVVQEIQSFWFAVVRLPSEPQRGVEGS